MGPPLLWIVGATSRNPLELTRDVKWLLSQLSPNPADQVHAQPYKVSDKVRQASHAPLQPLHSPPDKDKPTIPLTRAHTCISLDSNGSYCLCCKIIMASICKFSYDLYSDLCFYQFLSCVTYQVVSSCLINIFYFSQSSEHHTFVDKILSKSL